MIRSRLLKPAIKDVDYGDGMELSLCFNRIDSDTFYGPEEMLNYEDNILFKRDSSSSDVVHALRELSNRIESACTP
jgi:hypothetical protein